MRPIETMQRGKQAYRKIKANRQHNVYKKIKQKPAGKTKLTGKTRPIGEMRYIREIGGIGKRRLEQPTTISITFIIKKNVTKSK